MYFKYFFSECKHWAINDDISINSFMMKIKRSYFPWL